MLKTIYLYLFVIFCCFFGNSQEVHNNCGILIESDDLYIRNKINKIYGNNTQIVYLSSIFYPDYKYCARYGYKSFSINGSNFIYNQYYDWTNLFYMYSERKPKILNLILFDSILTGIISNFKNRQPLNLFLNKEIRRIFDFYLDKQNRNQIFDLFDVMYSDGGCMSFIKYNNQLIPINNDFSGDIILRFNNTFNNSLYNWIREFELNECSARYSILLKKIYDYTSQFNLNLYSQLWFSYRIHFFQNDYVLSKDFAFKDLKNNNSLYYTNKCRELFLIDENVPQMIINGDNFGLIYLHNNKLYYAKSYVSAKYLYDLFLYLNNKPIPNSLLSYANRNNIRELSPSLLWKEVLKIEYFEYGQIDLSPSLNRLIKSVYDKILLTNINKQITPDIHLIIEKLFSLNLNEADIYEIYYIQHLLFNELNKNHNPWFSKQYKFMYR